MPAAAAHEPMTLRPLLLAAMLAIALVLLPLASAQFGQRSQLTLSMSVPTQAITEAGAPLSFSGTVTFVGDATYYTQTNGIPISYVVTKQPAWATVIVSPATDVIPLPSTPTSVNVYGSRPFQVTVVLDPAQADQPDFPRRLTDQIEVTATAGWTMFSGAASGKSAVPLVVSLPDVEPCHEVDTQALLTEAVDAYNAYQAQQEASSPSTEPSDVTVQSTGASPVPLPYAAVGGFALVGAGIGLVLQRRLRP